MHESCCVFYVEGGMCNFFVFLCNDNKTKLELDDVAIVLSHAPARFWLVKSAMCLCPASHLVRIPPNMLVLSLVVSKSQDL